MQCHSSVNDERRGLDVSASLVAENHEIGIFNIGSDLTVQSSVLRDTAPNGQGLFGDGIAVLPYSRPATSLISGTRLEANARAGLCNFGPTVTFGWNAFRCNAFDLEGEEYVGSPFAFDHLGGNLCGCQEATEECQVLSAGLEPPEPLEPLDPLQ